MWIAAEHASSTFSWQGNPGIESWQVSLGLSFDGNTSTPRPLTEVVIATASMWRVHTELCEEIGYELDNISGDLGMIGSAIDEAQGNDEDWCQEVGSNSEILIATDVVVDSYWRGGGLGPALLFLAADLLRADVICLSPAALSTRVLEGVCRSCESPILGSAAQAKVEAAWGRAGFSPLADDVVWTPSTSATAAAARERVIRLEEEADVAHVRAWWRRRALRVAPSASNRAGWASSAALIHGPASHDGV